MKATKHRFWLCALLVCMVLSVFAGITAPPAMAANISSTDWMETVPDETKLSNMSIPGTHDSCTQYVDMRYIFQCQDASVATQLIYGYRYLDMRLVLEQKHDQQTLVLKHSIARCKTSNSPFAGTLTLDDVLRDVSAFLDAHPTETVILCMKAENSKDDVAEIQKVLYQTIDKDPERWYLKNEIPTLGEVRGKIVLATRFDDKFPVGFERCGLYFGWADQGDRTVLSDPTANSVINGRETLCVQDRYNYDVGDKIPAIRTCLDSSRAADDTFFLNFTSTSGSGAVGHPKEYAKDINLDLYAYEWEAGKAYGVVIVDFGPKKIAEKIYGTNFSVTGCTPEHSKTQKPLRAERSQRLLHRPAFGSTHRLQQAVRRPRKSLHPTGCLFLR